MGIAFGSQYLDDCVRGSLKSYFSKDAYGRDLMICCLSFYRGIFFVFSLCLLLDLNTTIQVHFVNESIIFQRFSLCFLFRTLQQFYLYTISVIDFCFYIITALSRCLNTQDKFIARLV